MHFRAAQKLLRAALPYCATLAWQAAASLDAFDMRISGWQGSVRVRREAAQARQPSKRLAGCSADVTTATRTVRRWRPFSRRCCAPTTRRWSETKIVLGTLSAGHAIAPSRTGGSQPTFSRARSCERVSTPLSKTRIPRLSRNPVQCREVEPPQADV